MTSDALVFTEKKENVNLTGRAVKLLLACLIAAICFSCVEEFQPELNEFENLLVVDGGITNEEGPYTILLNISSGLENIKQEPVMGATIIIREENGPFEVLSEITPGTYQTAPGGIKGETGKRYRIEIAVNGKLYESDYELLKEPTAIESVQASLTFKAFPDASEEVPGYQFYINTELSPYEQDYYLWRMEGTYKYESDFFIFYVYEGSFIEFKNHDSLKVCYRTYTVGDVFTTNTNNLIEPKVLAKPLNFLPAIDNKLSIRYSLLTRQYSIGKEAYEFWHAIERQTSGNASLYTGQPYQIRGNVKNTDNPDEPILGYFLVAGVSENRIFVDRPLNVGYYLAGCQLDYEGMQYVTFTSPDEWPVYITVGEEGRALSGSGCMDCRQLSGVLNVPDFWIE